jgi:glucokinase
MESGRLAVVAIDVGGTSLKAGILGPAGCPVLRRVPSGRDRGPDAVLDNTAAIAEALVEECDALGLAVAGIGVAVPGIVDDQGVGLLSVTLGWRDVPVRRRLAERLGRPVEVRHDVRAAAVAETSLGAAAGARSALFVPIGTGIAGALVIDGVIHAGAAFRAGEIGQIHVAPGTTLEDVASARAIGERYAAASGRPAGSVDAHEVADLVVAGDPDAIAVWGEAVGALGGVFASVVAALDPETIVIGGGVGRAGATLTTPLAAAIASHLPWRDVPAIVGARFGADAGFVGVAIEAWRAAGHRTDELAAGVAAARWDASEVSA